MENPSFISLLATCATNKLKNTFGVVSDSAGTIPGFKFKEGDVLTTVREKDEMYRDAKGKGWRVVEVIPKYSQPDMRKEDEYYDPRADLYAIDVGNGVIQKHFAWNINYRMRQDRPTTVVDLVRELSRQP